MIKKSKLIEIQRLLKEGKISQRKIALHLGVSRTAVKAVSLKINEIDKTKEKKRKADTIVPPKGKPKRCPNCGGFVKMPCLACQLKSMKVNRITAATCESPINAAAKKIQFDGTCTSRQT